MKKAKEKRISRIEIAVHVNGRRYERSVLSTVQIAEMLQARVPLGAFLQALVDEAE